VVAPARLRRIIETDVLSIPHNHESHAAFPHAGLSDEINRNIIRSEIEGGVFLDHLPEGTELEVQTQNRCYRILWRGRGQVLISGHPEFCPEPVPVKIHGSTWGGSMVRLAFIGRGMHLEFRHPEHKTITSSRIIEVRSRTVD
jgi:hypothetical protein